MKKRQQLRDSFDLTTRHQPSHSISSSKSGGRRPFWFIPTFVLLIVSSCGFAWWMLHSMGLADPDDSTSSFSYAIILDAGSTGSRIHIYKFSRPTAPSNDTSNGGGLFLESDLFDYIKPGLSHYAQQNAEDSDDYTSAAAHSLDKLMDLALEAVPRHLHSSTPIMLAATAGLRLLPGHQAEDIMRAVYEHLSRAYPFKLLDGQNSVYIMDGTDEAIYAWMTVNYLLSRFGQSHKNITAGVLDLGGGSTQIVFEPNYDGVLNAGGHGDRHQNHFVTKHLHPHSYTVYQHSFLGYGLIEARKRIHSSIGDRLLVTHITDTEKRLEIVQSYREIHGYTTPIDMDVLTIVEHPCVPEGHFHMMLDGGEKEQVLLVGSSQSSDADTHDKYELCSSIVSDLFDKSMCSHQESTCSFNNIFQPNLKDSYFTRHIDSEMYIFSYFYDRTRLKFDMEAVHFDEWTLDDLHLLARMTCNYRADHSHPHWSSISMTKNLSTRFEDIKKLADYIANVVDNERKRDSHLCLDLTFMYHLLSTGYGLENTQRLRIEKKINDIETGWCLGAALDLLNKNRR